MRTFSAPAGTTETPPSGRDAASLYSWAGLLSGGLLVLSGFLPWVQRGPGSSLTGIEIAAALRGELDLGTSASRAGLVIIAIMVVGVLQVASAAIASRSVTIARGISAAIVGAVIVGLLARLGATAWATGEIAGVIGVLIAIGAAVATIQSGRRSQRDASAHEGATTAIVRRPPVGVAVCLCAALLSAGALGYGYRYGRGRPGAASPSEAVAKFFGAVNDNDALVLATSVDPNEAERAGALVAALAQRLGVDDVGTWGESDSSFKIAVNVARFKLVEQSSDAASFEVDGTLTLSGLQLPRPLEAVFGSSVEVDFDRLGPSSDEAGTSGLVISVVRQGGRWYVSPLALAEDVRQYGLSMPARVVESKRHAIEDVLQQLDWGILTKREIADHVGEAALPSRSLHPGLPQAQFGSTRFTPEQLPFS